MIAVPGLSNTAVVRGGPGRRCVGVVTATAAAVIAAAVGAVGLTKVGPSSVPPSQEVTTTGDVGGEQSTRGEKGVAVQPGREVEVESGSAGGGSGMDAPQQARPKWRLETNDAEQHRSLRTIHSKESHTTNIHTLMTGDGKRSGGAQPPDR